MSSPPRDFRMPAEWHPHTATWLSWPHNLDTWPPHLLPAVERTYAEMIRLLLTGERVDLLVTDEAMERRAREVVGAVDGLPYELITHQVPTIDAWIRDYGPTFVVDVAPHHPVTRKPSVGTLCPRPPLAMVNWRFNGWGGKYPEYERDREVPARINERVQVPRFEPGIVFEGGSIEVNGRGTVLTTEQCLLNPNRNPHLNRAELDQVMGDYLGVTQVVWLGQGIAGDDTDGHVDDLARFVNETTVVCVVEDDPADENHASLQANFELLGRSKDQDGQPLHLVPLPMPDPVYTDESSIFTTHQSPLATFRRLPASYANFLIGNAVVLVPVFDDPNDARALAILQELFPTRHVVGLDCRALVFGYGSIHCVSQQQPQPLS